MPTVWETWIQDMMAVFDTAGIVCDRVFVTVRRPSLCPIYRPLQQRVAGLLLGALRRGQAIPTIPSFGAALHSIVVKFEFFELYSLLKLYKLY